MVHIKRSNLLALFVIAFVTALFIFIMAPSAEAASRCKSSAYDKATAEEYCGEKLGCEDKNPPKVLVCRGRTNNWKCSCKGPRKKPKKQEEMPASLFLDQSSTVETFYQIVADYRS